MKNHRALIGITILSLVLAAIAFPFLPVHDPASYFNLADAREFLGVPNVGDVLSNLAFLFVGVYWFFVLRNEKSHPLHKYAAILCAVSVFTALGSAYFHWSPGPGRLVWDRLPMSIGFASIVGMIIADRMSSVIGWRATLLLAPLGVITVFGHWFEFLSLRPYIILQFGSILFLMMVALLQRRGRIDNLSLWSAVGLYFLAKLFEVMDHQVYNTLGVLSGHTLKHFFAAASVFVLLSFLRNRKPA